MKYSAFASRYSGIRFHRVRTLGIALLCLLLISLLFAARIASAPRELPHEVRSDLLRDAYSMDHYNNYTGRLNDDFGIFGDQVVYWDAKRIQVAQKDGETLTLADVPALRTAFLKRFYYSGNLLYFSDGNKLFCCDLNTGDVSQVFQMGGSTDWAVVDDTCYYLTTMPYAEQDKAPLHACDLKSGEDRVICPETSAFGIVDGKVRYISCQEDYLLFEYDAERQESTLLGSFPAAFGMNCVFNFTRNAVVMGRYGLDNYNFDYKPGYSNKFAVYTIQSGEMEVYTLPREIQELVACDAYAYAMVYNTVWDSRDQTAEEENGYYRICLSTGEWERIPETVGLDGVTGIFVKADDCVYISQYHVYPDARGAVYRYDTQTCKTDFFAWIN